jgi:hypothetical protein
VDEAEGEVITDKLGRLADGPEIAALRAVVYIEQPIKSQLIASSPAAEGGRAIDTNSSPGLGAIFSGSLSSPSTRLLRSRTMSEMNPCVAAISGEDP